MLIAHPELAIVDITVRNILLNVEKIHPSVSLAWDFKALVDGRSLEPMLLK